MNSRIVPAGTVVFDQIDIYMPGQNYVRVQGLDVSSLLLKTFFNNVDIQWTLQQGVGVTDQNVLPNYVYFNEIVGSPGYYSIRFFPTSTGFWRLIFQIPSYSQEYVLEYDSMIIGSNISLGGTCGSNSIIASVG